MTPRSAVEHEEVIEILTSSFQTNRSVDWVIGPAPDREARRANLIRYACRCADTQGHIWRSDDGLASAITILPSRPVAFAEALARNLFFIRRVTGIGRLLPVLRRERYIARFHPQPDFVYLWFIGVRPEHQSRGLGGALLERIVAAARAEGRPIYLETSSPRNVSFYVRHGFAVHHEWHSELCGFPLWFLHKRP